MNNLNSVLLEGELIKDPDYRNDRNGNPVCRFTLSSNRFFKGDAGIEKETGYFDIETTGKLALQCTQHGHQGRGVRVVGRLTQEHSRNEEGKPAARIVITAEHVEWRPTVAQSRKPAVHHDEDYEMGR
jgi:single-strand DNA-binding protein